ncbi:MAG: tryptophan--tRNA ligase [Mycoplasma sp.]|nr:tryptophan--tRNA ligase [Mycoplasma sp.]
MKKLLSGIQPSNKLTLGNYFGAIKSYVDFQNDFDSYIFVANLHVITNPKIDFKSIIENTKMVVCMYSACGLDLKKNHVFIQSDVAAHPQLEHILMCNSTIGELNRMTQFKDKSKKFTNANGTDTIPAGLFTYPVLMAADILLYDPEFVPVGSDQKQHMELTQNLAMRMNKKYGEMFTIPKPYIPKVGARIMDLQDPKIKMSKSTANQKGVIYLLDEPEVARKKIMSAKTDSLNQVKFDVKNQPGVSNLIGIYSALTNLPVMEIEKKYKNKNYGDFKKDLADKLVIFLIKIQKNYHDVYKDYEKKIVPILKENAKYLNKIANKKLDLVYKKVGLEK